MRKKGVSDVIVTVILVALAIGLVAIVWATITKIVSKELSGAEACFGNFEKVNLNQRYTCQNSSSNELQFSISIKDVENLNEILVSVYGNGEIKNIRIDGNSSYDYAKNFADNEFGNTLILPQKNQGKTYILDLAGLGIEKVDTIEIVPVIGEEQCDISDAIYSVDDCRVLV